MSLALNSFLYLLDLERDNLAELLGRRVALILKHECIGGILDLVADGNLALRAAHHTAIIGDGLKDTLTDPPDGIGDELESAGLVELVGGSNEAHIAFADKVDKGNALMLVLFGYGYNEA